MIRCGSQISWVVQPGSVLLVNDATHESLTLPYPQAAVWDLLTRHPAAEVARKMTYIADLSPERAAALVEQSVETWIRLGYLQWEAVHG